jgi:succinate-acetate transporter protein
MAIALYIAFAMLVNPASGRTVFPIAGPMWAPKPPAPPSA